MKSVRTEGCHVGLFREFVGTACCTYGQSNTTTIRSLKSWSLTLQWWAGSSSGGRWRLFLTLIFVEWFSSNIWWNDIWDVKMIQFQIRKLRQLYINRFYQQIHINKEYFPQLKNTDVINRKAWSIAIRIRNEIIMHWDLVSIIDVYGIFKWSDTLWTVGRVRLFANYTISLSSLCRTIWRHWTTKMLVRYMLPSVHLRLRQFSQLSFIQYVGLCIFSLPNSPVMIVRMCTLSYYHNQTGSINH